MNVLVGVDGGGSGTRAVVLRESGDGFEVLGRGEAGPSNPYAVGAERAAAHCEAAALEALSNAARIVPHLTRAEVAAWGFGLAGVRRASDAAQVRPYLAAIAGASPFELDTDAAAAHAGAFGGGGGVVLVAGTGAICIGRDDGHTFYADGWGPLLGDEGGGYWMGLEALKAICRASDGRGPQTRLAAPIFTALGVRDADEVVVKIYRNGFDREEVARLARTVFDAAAQDVRVAASIRDRATDLLAGSAAAVAHAMLSRHQERGLAGQTDTPLELPVALCGGLFADDLFRAGVGYRIGEHLIELKRDFLPLGGWRIVRPAFDAATGAALLARKLL